MKLLTKKLETELRRKQTNIRNYDDAIVKAHWFNPSGAGDWFGIELVDGFDDIVFGYVSIFGDWNDELGDFSLSELESIKLPPFGLGIERDLHWTPRPLSEIKKEYTRI